MHQLGPFDLQGVVVSEMRSPVHDRGNSLENLRRGMAEQQRSVPHQEIDELLAVDIPFAASFPPFDIHRQRFGVSQIMTDLSRENP